MDAGKRGALRDRHQRQPQAAVKKCSPGHRFSDRWLLFVKPKQEPQAVKAARPKVKLTNAEKREIKRIIENAKGDGKARTAQDTLPFRQMYPDGLCRLDEKTQSRCIEIAAQTDDFDHIRECYTQMLRGQLEHGNNGRM